jgi:hypothetical protein
MAFIGNWDARNRTSSWLAPLLQISPDDLDDVFRRFVRGLRIPGHVIADVILEKLSHQAVDRAACGGQSLENIGARGVLFQSPLNGLQLPYNFFGAVEEIEFCAREM